MGCNSNARYMSNSGMTQISTPNPQRDGTGAMGTVITGARNGTIVSTITIIATGMTTQGMVRLFLDDGANTNLLTEVVIPATTPTNLVRSFALTVTPGITIQSGWSIKASTENAETFNVIATGRDYEYCDCTA